MKRSIIAIALLSTMAFAGVTVGGVVFDKLPLNQTAASVSNGGSVPDNTALKDGVGVYVSAFGEESKPDYKEVNKALLDLGDEALEQNKLVRDLKPELFDPAIWANYDTCADAPVGSYTSDGLLVVDRALLDQKIAEGYDLSKVCTTHVTDMSGLFRQKVLSYDLSRWDVSNVTDFSYMFNCSAPGSYGARCDYDFGDLSNWNVSKGVNFVGAFGGRQGVNVTDFSKWNIASAEQIGGMFAYSDFNQPLDSWAGNLDKITNCNYFITQTPFNQDLSSWTLTTSTNCYLTKFKWDAFSYNKPTPNFQ